MSLEKNNFVKLKLFFKKRSLIVLVIILVLFLIFLPPEILDKESMDCGDGTLNNTCSLIQPYFCEEGVLVERASICGCSNLLTKKDELCISNYQIGGKSANFEYVLRGEKGKISFTVYKGMADYLTELPAEIFYGKDEQPLRADFKIRNINEEQQRELLLPLVVEIQNLANDINDQIRIAVSLVQHIPFGSSEKMTTFGPGIEINYSRYPYEVLYDNEGVCGEKSELLAFLLREMGYGVAFFYYQPENHESLGVLCQSEYSLKKTHYCFIETTGPSIITDNEIIYVGGIKLLSEPQVIPISEGESFNGNLYEYDDAEDWKKIRNAIQKRGRIGILQYFKKKHLVKKYNLDGEYNV